MLDCAQISLHPEGKVDASLRGCLSAAVCVSRCRVGKVPEYAGGGGHHTCPRVLLPVSKNK